MTIEVTIQMLQKQMRCMLDYLNPLLPMANSPMVSYLTNNLWKQAIPVEIQHEIRTNADIERAMDIYWKQFNDKSIDSSDDVNDFKHFRAFLTNASKYRVDNFRNLWISPEELKKNLDSDVSEAQLMKGFMSTKKNHEVCDLDEIDFYSSLLLLISDIDSLAGGRYCRYNCKDLLTASK